MPILPLKISLLPPQYRSIPPAGKYCKPRTPPIVRFLTKVNKLGPLWNGTHCWEWLGADHGRGYGGFGIYGKHLLAYNWYWKLVNGDIPYGMELDHLCRNRLCVNPDHIETVTPYINFIRGQSPNAINARKTHCKRGHELSGNNLYMDRFGRHCIACRRKTMHEWWIAKRSKSASNSS